MTTTGEGNSALDRANVFTIHSQKGGVGKTSVALGIAGLAAIRTQKRVLLVDADLTGASIEDFFKRDKGPENKPKYLNDLLLAEPHTFMKHTPAAVERDVHGRSLGLSTFARHVDGCDNLDYIPGSSYYEDVLKVVPLLSQEDYLHFFRHRFEDLVKQALHEKYQTIIIDNPPGLFGLSAASATMALRKKPTPKNVGALTTTAIFITTGEAPDYRMMISSLSRLLVRHDLEVCDELMKEHVRLVINKSGNAKGGENRALLLGEIFADMESLPKSRFNDGKLLSALKSSATTQGAIPCSFISDFDVSKMVETIVGLPKDLVGFSSNGMAKWCIQLGESLGLLNSTPLPMKKDIKNA